MWEYEMAGILIPAVIGVLIQPLIIWAILKLMGE